DLYVVNGMIAENLFSHLPHGELVETNRAFRNRGDGTFTPAPEWQLGTTASGRGMILADLDGDGDLDIVVNNLRSAAQIFENRLCGGNGLAVDVGWGGTPNTHAIGTQLELHTSAGVLRREIRVAAGYLSSDAPWVHFGVPDGATIERLDIIFPDGLLARVLAPPPHTHIEVRR
ncbi:MAG TPA: FG-GAP-like repeat-containing protein, partial [Roseiflexaceae bacterium]|nr:FG-GAP-like repeat-containing protein [Roseiflexaceae bacterium]